MKECFKCHVVKPVEDFYKHPKMGDGRLGKCKECAKADVHKNYRTNKKHYVEYERIRTSQPERKKHVSLYQKKMTRLNPEKKECRRLTYKAIKNGRLTKLPCEVCGDSKSQAHHVTYDDPFNIRWLCFKHHRKLHGQETF